MLIDASRDWTLLDSMFQQTLLKVFLRMREQGYEMALIDGYRSPERQNKLAALGGGVNERQGVPELPPVWLGSRLCFLARWSPGYPGTRPLGDARL